MSPAPVIVGICGASGVRYGVELLRALRKRRAETHLIMSHWAERVLCEEGGGELAEVHALASTVYDNDDLAAAPSSSSFLAAGMAIVPATVKTVSAIATASADSLIARSADNMLRSQRPLVVGIRETPLSAPCLENLARLAGWGAVVLPLSPGFYHRPQTLQDLFDFITDKVLDALRLPNPAARRWRGGGARRARR
jgi:gallate decarboxylase subunit B